MHNDYYVAFRSSRGIDQAGSDRRRPTTNGSFSAPSATNTVRIATQQEPRSITHLDGSVERPLIRVSSRPRCFKSFQNGTVRYKGAAEINPPLSPPIIELRRLPNGEMTYRLSVNEPMEALDEQRMESKYAGGRRGPQRV
jgi:hypothetical protein